MISKEFLMNHHSLFPNPLRQQAYQIIKEAIIYGTFAEGEMIPERRAKEELGISRTPFREAIQALEAEGWVYTIPYKGAFVSPITRKDMEDLFELRILLETFIGQKIQDKLTSKHQLKLQLFMEEMKEAVELSKLDLFIRLDRVFHHYLASLSENNRLITVYEQTLDLMRRMGMRALQQELRNEEVLKEHQAIIDSFQTGNVETSLLSHLENTKIALLSHIKGEHTS
jgi:DNA-binding GntR family transcriptional regulator